MQASLAASDVQRFEERWEDIQDSFDCFVAVLMHGALVLWVHLHEPLLRGMDEIDAATAQLVQDGVDFASPRGLNAVRQAGATLERVWSEMLERMEACCALDFDRALAQSIECCGDLLAKLATVKSSSDALIEYQRSAHPMLDDVSKQVKLAKVQRLSFPTECHVLFV